jgi:thiaminase
VNLLKRKTEGRSEVAPMNNLARLLAAQRQAADIVQSANLVLRIMDGKINKEALPFYLLSDDPLVAAAARIKLAGSSTSKHALRKMYSDARAMRDRLKEICLAELNSTPELEVDAVTAQATYDATCKELQDEIVTLGLMEVNYESR